MYHVYLDAQGAYFLALRLVAAHLDDRCANSQGASVNSASQLETMVGVVSIRASLFKTSDPEKKSWSILLRSPLLHLRKYIMIETDQKDNHFTCGMPAVVLSIS